MVGICPWDVVVEEQGGKVVLGAAMVGPLGGKVVVRKVVGGRKRVVVLPPGLPVPTVVLGQGPSWPPGMVQSTTTIVVVVGQGPIPPPGRTQS